MRPGSQAPIARLASLLPQLAIVLRRDRGDVPEVLQAAGGKGERHVAMLISLAISGPGTVSELADRLDLSTAHASLVVGELAKAGLVDRDHDNRDRRLIIVSLSDAAKPAVAEMRRRRSGPLRAFLGELDPDEAEAFIGHLDRLLEILREAETPSRRRGSHPSR
jgi:DNA-binding MarR family transcriptional regulator